MSQLTHFDEVKKEWLASTVAQKKRLLTELAATLHNVNHYHTYACANQEGTEEAAIGDLKSELPTSQAVHLLCECEVILNTKAAAELEQQT